MGGHEDQREAVADRVGDRVEQLAERRAAVEELGDQAVDLEPPAGEVQLGRLEVDVDAVEAARLGELLSVPVELHDERLTTRQAERTGGGADADSRAAAHLLEAYLAGSGRAT